MIMQTEPFDVVVVGGSYAGMSAAMSLGRSRRRVLVADAGASCNAPSPHAHNLLLHDGVPPRVLAARAREQVLMYPTVSWHNGFATSVERQGNQFKVATAEGYAFSGRALLLATGIKDIFPAIPGLRECWGKSVLHCPYCHGYEVRDRRIAVMASHETALHLTGLVRNLSEDVIVLTHGETLTDEERSLLKRWGVSYFDTPVQSLIHDSGNLREVELSTGERVGIEAMFIRLDFEHHTDISIRLGCRHTDTGHIAVDAMGETSVPGVYAAGDCASPHRSLSAAIASGSMAGAAINRALLSG